MKYYLFIDLVGSILTTFEIAPADTDDETSLSDALSSLETAVHDSEFTFETPDGETLTANSEVFETNGKCIFVCST